MLEVNFFTFSNFPLKNQGGENFLHSIVCTTKTTCLRNAREPFEINQFIAHMYMPRNRAPGDKEKSS